MDTAAAHSEAELFLGQKRQSKFRNVAGGEEEEPAQDSVVGVLQAA